MEWLYQCGKVKGEGRWRKRQPGHKRPGGRLGGPQPFLLSGFPLRSLVSFQKREVGGETSCKVVSGHTHPLVSQPASTLPAFFSFFCSTTPPSWTSALLQP